ncbi:unnamed protein product [Phytophthora fragariaefolia]|uniref:Unnamed protein product n=1 Tax=Phytophthora fragariaefolia TaxID=1490495 RepID=A0A9W6U1E3_9STRA|nr:unnamed protein product [Phytophthora fragariaefolia]
MPLDDQDAAISLLGTWESNEAFGNTALDWSQAVKDQRVQLHLTFESENAYKFRLVSNDADVTSNFRHVIASEGTYELQGENGIVIHRDMSGIKWTYLFEEKDSLRIRYAGVAIICPRRTTADCHAMCRLEGAKLWGRCKGVDVIYFARAKAEQ